MGYRSQVVLAISKHLTPFLTLKVTQNKAAESLVFADADTFDRDYGGDKSWLLVWDCIKWYESYEDIQALEKFIEEACSDEYKFEIDGKKEHSSDHIRFVRVGEESADIDLRGDGFWDIYPHTSISY
jgi:hypothetical protein|tara:strand:- start:381 stop:761 length:381 start_codon:yes stop_codon:yes gene_type:complete